MMRLESLLESYTKKIQGFQNLTYWDRLSKLKMTSIQRRFERYKIIYYHKILYNLTDNCNLDWSYSDKFGYNFTLEKCDPKAKANKRRLQSFRYSGTRLYNSIPLYLRKKCKLSLLSWKNLLDKYLEQIPDNPEHLRFPLAYVIVIHPDLLIRSSDGYLHYTFMGGE